MANAVRPSPLGLAVLGLLYGGPLHPYRMQRLLKEWGKDQVINIGQRSSLYKTIGRLEQSGLIAVRQTERERQYPERTVYELTEHGRDSLLTWLNEMISLPRNEYPSFPAALSFLMLLGPQAALAALRRRGDALRATLTTLGTELARYSESLPRVTLLEVEYQRAVTAAALTWVESVIEDLAQQKLTWTDNDFSDAADAYLLDDPADTQVQQAGHSST
jgi:DNA-binding PadR family transcriptional regulator